MSDNEPAERGPNYNWQHEAEHYRSECESLRKLIHKLEIRGDKLFEDNYKLRAENDRLKKGWDDTETALNAWIEKLKNASVENGELKTKLKANGENTMDYFDRSEKEKQFLRSQFAIARDALMSSIQDLNISLEGGIYKPPTVEPLLNCRRRLREDIAKLDGGEDRK